MAVARICRHPGGKASGISLSPHEANDDALVSGLAAELVMPPREQSNKKNHDKEQHESTGGRYVAARGAILMVRAGC